MIEAWRDGTMIEVPAKLACGRLRASAANQRAGNCMSLLFLAKSGCSREGGRGMRVILPFVKVGDSVQRPCSYCKGVAERKESFDFGHSRCLLRTYLNCRAALRASCVIRSSGQHGCPL
jgi:hypothetical protein